MSTSAPPRRRGRPRRLTLAQVIDATVTVVEARGAAALTMEAVATELGVGTMTLYSYVGSRDELIDRAVASLLDRAPPVVAESPGASWIDNVVAHCLAARRWAMERPALFLLDADRPRLSDAVATRYAAEIAALMRAGFASEDAAVLRHALAVLLVGQIQFETVRRVADRTGVRAANRARVRSGKVPAEVRAASEAIADVEPEVLFEQSLRALLAGFDARRERETP